MRERERERERAHVRREFGGENGGFGDVSQSGMGVQGERTHKARRWPLALG